MAEFVKLVVNGTLMRGLNLNQNLLNVGAKFISESTTAPEYRLWSINDEYPAMVRVDQKGAAVVVEVWEMSAVGLVKVLKQEPSGLCIGKIKMIDGKEILGVLAEPLICEGQKEITAHGSWRVYISEGT